MKFGGTSVKDAESREHMLRHVMREAKAGYKVLVVVSAMGRLGAPYATDTLKNLVSNRITKQESDRLLTCGEVISSVVVSDMMIGSGLHARSLAPIELGITTDGDYSDAYILGVNPDVILEKFNDYDVLIAPGFVGVSEVGYITTLGRGGSDTTAIALGAAVDAEVIDIYSDVPGVMTNDPKKDPDATLIKEICYDKLIKMSEEGAKVIHLKAIRMAKENQVNLRFRSTFADEIGTCVRQTSNQEEPLTLGSIITAAVTPFDESGQISTRNLERLLHHLIQNGTTSIAVTGTTGEAPTLTSVERMRIWETAVDFANGRFPIIAGVGTNNTKTTIHNVKLAEEVGVDVLLIVTPYYNKPNQKGLLKHFKKIAKATNLPIILYNIPARTGVNLEPKTILELAKEKNIIGIKDSSGDLELLKKLQKAILKDFALYTGDDANYLDALELGGAGVVSVASHLVGQKMAQVHRLHELGRLEDARTLNGELMPFYEGIFKHPNPAPIKALLNEYGIYVGDVRSPLTKLDERESQALFLEFSDLLE